MWHQALRSSFPLVSNCTFGTGIPMIIIRVENWERHWGIERRSWTFFFFWLPLDDYILVPSSCSLDEYGEMVVWTLRTCLIIVKEGPIQSVGEFFPVKYNNSNKTICMGLEKLLSHWNFVVISLEFIYLCPSLRHY